VITHFKQKRLAKR